MFDLPLILYNFKATAQSDQFAETAAGEAGAPRRDWQEEVRRHQEKAPEAPEGKRRHQEKAGSAVEEQEKERLDGSTAVKKLVSSAISANSNYSPSQVSTNTGLTDLTIDVALTM